MNINEVETSRCTGDDTQAELEQALARIARLEQTNARLRQFVPGSVRRLIETAPDAALLAKHDMDLSVMFLDVEGYTALSDRSAPQRLAELIELYFARFVDAIHEQGGEVTETAGDGMMALFQDRSPCAHARKAARAALAILRRACELRAHRHAASRLTINLGIDSGVASVGPRCFAGRLEVRCTYTATGAVTNRAARLQQAARGGCAYVSEATARRLSTEFHVSDLGPRAMHNLTTPIRIFRLDELPLGHNVSVITRERRGQRVVGNVAAARLSAVRRHGS